MNKKLSFAVENITPIDDINLDKSEFALLRVDAFATGKSYHDTFTTEENLRKNAQTLIQKPFVFFTDKRFDDAGGHDDGEVAVGFVPHNTRMEFKKLEDGRTMLSCDVLVWRRYSGDLLRFFNRDGGRKGVSVEIEISESKEDKESGLLELITYCFNAITCLGDLISPAIPNAEAVLQFSREFEKAKEKYEFSSKYEEIDFSIPKKVKSNAQKSLDVHKQKGRGATSIALAVGRHLAKEEKTTPEKIRQMSKFFSRKNLNAEDISFGLYGGKDGMKWSQSIRESLDQIDAQRMRYFNVEKNESSFAEDNDPDKKEEVDMKKKKDEAVVEEEKLDMAAEPEKEEKPEDLKEDMAAEEEKETPEKEKSETSEDEKKEEMSAEESKEEKPEDKEDEFSFGFDPSVAMSMMPEENEFCKMARDEFAKGKDANFGVIANGMYAALVYCNGKMSEMASEKETYMAEMSSLKEFKAEREEAEKKFAVDLTLKELSEKFIIPEETISEMREDGYKAEFSKLEDWKLSTKAKSVDFAIAEKKDGKDDVVRVGLIWNTSPKKTQDNLWVNQ